MPEDGRPDVWVLELSRGTLTRLTFQGFNWRPIWSPDGERIIYRAGDDIFVQRADGTGEAEQLASGALRGPTSVSSDGRTIIFIHSSTVTGNDIGMVRLDGDPEPEILLGTDFDEHSGILSPDDHWLAYVSNESGRNEVYVRAFPGLEGRVQVSTAGGVEPMWSRDGRELFYRNGDQMMAVAVSTEKGLIVGKPTLLFEEQFQAGIESGAPGTNYDIAPDGRFLMIQVEEAARQTQLNVVLNWLPRGAR
jgi:Tol biopolymer transport system component